MGLAFGLNMLAGALANGLMNGFSPLNTAYVALSGLLAVFSFFTHRKKHLTVTVGKLRIGAGLAGVLVFGIVLILASKVLTPESRFSDGDRLNESARLIGRGDTAAAGKILQRLYEKDPANPLVHLNLGVVYLKERKTDLVRQHLDAAARQLSADENLWFNYGQMYNQLKDYKNAQGCFEKALVLNPDMTEAAIYAGTMSFKLRELQRSVYHLERARLMAPDSPEILLHLGRAQFERMNFDAAEEAFTTALELRPSTVLGDAVREQLDALKAARGGITP